MKTIVSQRKANMKKLIILAAMVLTIGVANANAGVSFEISVGGHNHGKGYSHGGHGGGYGYHAPHYGPPRHAPPRYVVRECVSCRPRYHHGIGDMAAGTVIRTGMDTPMEVMGTGIGTNTVHRN